jgi:hypothetical protein
MHLRAWSGARLSFLVASLFSILGCRSREAEVHAIIERAASDIESGTSDDIKLAICSVRPGSHVKLRAERLSVKLTGEENGTGEMSVTLVADSGLRCEGTAKFTYGSSPNKGSSQRYYVRNFERVSAHGPVVAAVSGRATSATLGAPIDVTLTDDWPLLPETSAAARTFQIHRDGRYSFVFPRTGARLERLVRRVPRRSTGPRSERRHLGDLARRRRGDDPRPRGEARKRGARRTGGQRKRELMGPMESGLRASAPWARSPQYRLFE